MENVKFDFADVPEWWPVCFHEGCEVAGRCMRQYAATLAPKGLQKAVAVTPQADGYGGERCVMFREKRTVRAAYGFSHLYDKVLKRHDTPIRQTLVNYFNGKRQYYWYLHGERPLSPEQQAWIQRLMSRYGYTEEVVFDRYEYRFEL